MAVRILHCHSTFAAGGKEARAVALMNAFGDRARHVVLSAMPDELGARTGIADTVDVRFPETGPALAGRASVERYRDIASYMRNFDLVLTYNWGAMDAVMARRMFGRELPPLIHHEDGFNADEAGRLKNERTWFRRLALPAANTLVVPSKTLEAIARRTWWRRDVVRIANGVDLKPHAARPIPGLARKHGEIVVGTLTGLRRVKNLPLLVRAAARVPTIRLVIVGDGPERAAVLTEALRCRLADRLVMPGHLDDPQGVIANFDVFALSSESEQAPFSLLEAMAAGLPIVATAVGDIGDMVAEHNARFVVRRDDEHAFANALKVLAEDVGLRHAIGQANRAKAETSFGAHEMMAAYARLYGGAIGVPGALGDF